jgi:hypothetical protein
MPSSGWKSNLNNVRAEHGTKVARRFDLDVETGKLDRALKKGHGVTWVRATLIRDIATQEEAAAVFNEWWAKLDQGIFRRVWGWLRRRLG